MRSGNLPSPSSPVTWTRGMSLWRVTVNDGAWAAAGASAAASAAKARRAGPALTSEAMIESQREAQLFSRRHRLRHVEPEPAPVDPQAALRDPAARGRQAAARHPARPAADQPGLAGVAERDEIRPLQREPGGRLLAVRPGRAARPAQGGRPPSFRR